MKSAARTNYIFADYGNISWLTDTIIYSLTINFIVWNDIVALKTEFNN